MDAEALLLLNRPLSACRRCLRRLLACLKLRQDWKEEDSKNMRGGYEGR